MESLDAVAWDRLLRTGRLTIMVLWTCGVCMAMLKAISQQREACIQSYRPVCHLHSVLQTVIVIFFYIAIAVFGGVFGHGTGPVILSGVRCTGNESSLLSCSHQIGVTYCSHYGAGVACPSCKTCIYWGERE